jgi:hypothetical protein
MIPVNPDSDKWLVTFCFWTLKYRDTIGILYVYEGHMQGVFSQPSWAVFCVHMEDICSIPTIYYYYIIIIISRYDIWGRASLNDGCKCRQELEH